MLLKLFILSILLGGGFFQNETTHYYYNLHLVRHKINPNIRNCLVSNPISVIESGICLRVAFLFVCQAPSISVVQDCQVGNPCNVTATTNVFKKGLCITVDTRQLSHCICKLIDE